MRLEILGRTLRGQNLPEVVLERVKKRWMFPEHVAGASDYSLLLEVANVDEGRWSLTEPRILEGMTVPVEVRADQDGFFFKDECGLLECLHLGSRTQVRMDFASGLSTLSPAFEDALHLSLVEGLRCSGLLSLHVAAVVLEGQTTVFSGPSGRGKSTTLLQAIRAGGIPVAEDLIWFDPLSGLVYGWERVVRLLPASLKYLPPGVPAVGWPVTSDSKINIPYSAFGSAPVRRGGAPIHRFMVLERRPDQPSGLAPLSSREAALAVWDSTGLPLARQAQQQIPGQIQSLLARTTFSTLYLGSTPLPFGPLNAAVVGEAVP